ncbi:MAG TPA: hypothetical protein VHT73_14715 [Thermodesulfobacteriota bacterium]|nr:hypothetical protein [Thermodesulfobacteriota bacterium]
MEKRERMRVIELTFLSELFVLSKDDTSRGYNMFEIGRKCGCSVKETKQIAEDLCKLDLVRNKRRPDEVSITPKGISLIKGERTVEYSAPIY